MNSLSSISVLFLAFICSLKAQPSEGGFRNYYAGTMDDSSKFQMDLTIETSHVKGIFYYQSIDHPLYLEGEPSSDGKFMLQAVNEKDSIEGQIVCFINPFSENIKGTWSNTKDSRSRSFQMQKTAEYVKISQEDDFIRAEASVPQFLLPKAAWQQLNLALNDINSENANNFVINQEDRLVINKTNIFLGWKHFTDYTIHYYSENFVSLLRRTEQYTVSDYPRITYASENIVVTDTGYRSIKLSELFLPDANYLQRLSDYIIKNLKDQKAAWAESGEINTLGEKDLREFTITPQYIEFIFPPNTVAPEDGGSWFVRIPYDVIAPYINPDSLLKEFSKYGVDYNNLIPGNK